MGNATIPEALVAYWRLVESALGPQPSKRFYDASFFDDNETSANHLSALVLAGRKRATAGLVWSFEFDGSAPPTVGALSVVTNWDGDPLCVIETKSVVVARFDRVDARFAAMEGEGDGTLEHWRKVHWEYFGKECARVGREPSATMPILCEQFEVVYRGPSR